MIKKTKCEWCKKEVVTTQFIAVIICSACGGEIGGKRRDRTKLSKENVCGENAISDKEMDRLLKGYKGKKDDDGSEEYRKECLKVVNENLKGGNND